MQPAESGGLGSKAIWPIQPAQAELPLDPQRVSLVGANGGAAEREGCRRLPTRPETPAHRPHGSIAYDERILSWNRGASKVSVWSLDDRLAIPFVCRDRQRELLAFQRGKTDLVYRDKSWFLFTTVDIPDVQEREALDGLGVDLGVVAIAQTSDGDR